MVGSIPKRALWRYSTRRAALAPTASPPRRTARCSSPRSPATISAKSILRPAPPRSWSRPCRVRARGGSGRTVAAALWTTGWNSGDLFRYDSKSKTWARWHLPGDRPQPYAVYVDETDAVWVSDWGANAILRFDLKTEKFDSFPLPDRYAGVRQLAGRKGEVWGAESGADKLFVLKTE
jgi:streptogramin lyase